jgi:undecaprenyl-diphosphatase
LGGFAILLIESLVRKIKFTSTDQIGVPTALKLGLFQSIAMIPGVSRSGATIMGGLLLGLDRKTATEFSFFLAIPTMFAATLYDLYKNWALLNVDSFIIIAIGFVTAFLAALLVVSKVIDFVSTHGFKPFAYYRILLGTLILLTL